METASAVGQAAAAGRRSQAAWYVGSTSADTRIDFRLSPSGQWVRGFRFGSPTISCVRQ
jgi:hypothetical protein